MIIGDFMAGFYVISVLQNHGISYSNHVHPFESEFETCLYFKPIYLFFCFQFERCTWFSIASQSDVAVDYDLLCHFLFLDMSEFLVLSCPLHLSNSMCTISHRALNVLLPVDDTYVVLCNVCGSALVQHSFHVRSDTLIQYTSYVNCSCGVSHAIARSCIMRSY